MKTIIEWLFVSSPTTRAKYLSRKLNIINFEIKLIFFFKFHIFYFLSLSLSICWRKYFDRNREPPRWSVVAIITDNKRGVSRPAYSYASGRARSRFGSDFSSTHASERPECVRSRRSGREQRVSAMYFIIHRRLYIVHRDSAHIISTHPFRIARETPRVINTRAAVSYCIISTNCLNLALLSCIYIKEFYSPDFDRLINPNV